MLLRLGVGAKPGSLGDSPLTPLTLARLNLVRVTHRLPFDSSDALPQGLGVEVGVVLLDVIECKVNRAT